AALVCRHSVAIPTEQLPPRAIAPGGPKSPTTGSSTTWKTATTVSEPKQGEADTGGRALIPQARSSAPKTSIPRSMRVKAPAQSALWVKQPAAVATTIGALSLGPILLPPRLTTPQNTWGSAFEPKLDL